MNETKYDVEIMVHGHWYRVDTITGEDAADKAELYWQDLFDHVRLVERA